MHEPPVVVAAPAPRITRIDGVPLYAHARLTAGLREGRTQQGAARYAGMTYKTLARLMDNHPLLYADVLRALRERSEAIDRETQRDYDGGDDE